jgi:proteasome lid subunit RPN8/RPN11
MTINYPDKLLSELKDLSIASDIEIVGFIDKNNQFHQKKNIHPDAKDYFLINPKEYGDLTDLVLFHSHPKHIDLKGFSEWDLENQKWFCLPMLLYSVNQDEFYFNP